MHFRIVFETYERGLARPSVGSVERIAEALGVPVAHLWAPPRERDVRIVRREEGIDGVRELLGGAPSVSVVRIG